MGRTAGYGVPSLNNADRAAQAKVALASQSEAEKAAQRWHKAAHTGSGFGKCWCCCTTCVYSNPHWVWAKRAAWADIVARLRASVAATRPPEDRRNAAWRGRNG